MGGRALCNPLTRYGSGWGRACIDSEALSSFTQASLVRNSPARPIDQASFEASSVRCMWPGGEDQIPCRATWTARPQAQGRLVWLFCILPLAAVPEYGTVADAEMHGIRSRRHLFVIHPSRLHPPASLKLGCTKVNQWWCSGSRWGWAEMSHSGVVGGGPAGHVQASWWLLVARALDTGQYMCHGSGANSDLLIEIDRHSYARFNVARSLSDRATRPFGA
jgi:hypothetical protein